MGGLGRCARTAAPVTRTRTRISARKWMDGWSNMSRVSVFGSVDSRFCCFGLVCPELFKIRVLVSVPVTPKFQFCGPVSPEFQFLVQCGLTGLDFHPAYLSSVSRILLLVQYFLNSFYNPVCPECWPRFSVTPKHSNRYSNKSSHVWL